MSASHPFVLCADDYGISPGVSAGIRELIEARRLSATSCLVASPHWAAEAPRLRMLADDADIGLHLTLTQFKPLGPMPRLAPAGVLPSPAKLFVLACAGRLDKREIADEIGRQLDVFEQAMGHAPVYVDGHHHIHQFPTVHAVLLEQFRRRLPRGTFLRTCGEPIAAIWRRGVARTHAGFLALTAHRLRRMARASDIPTNCRFAGVLDFTEQLSYRELFPRFIAGAPMGLAVMCHPGHPDQALAELDGVVEKRADELAYLASEAFVQDMKSAGLQLARFKELPV